jgi:hypothetical protein
MDLVALKVYNGILVADLENVDGNNRLLMRGWGLWGVLLQLGGCEGEGGHQRETVSITSDLGCGSSWGLASLCRDKLCKCRLRCQESLAGATNCSLGTSQLFWLEVCVGGVQGYHGGQSEPLACVAWCSPLSLILHDAWRCWCSVLAECSAGSQALHQFYTKGILVSRAGLRG